MVLGWTTTLRADSVVSFKEALRHVPIQVRQVNKDLFLVIGIGDVIPWILSWWMSHCLALWLELSMNSIISRRAHVTLGVDWLLHTMLALHVFIPLVSVSLLIILHGSRISGTSRLGLRDLVALSLRTLRELSLATVPWSSQMGRSLTSHIYVGKRLGSNHSDSLIESLSIIMIPLNHVGRP